MKIKKSALFWTQVVNMELRIPKQKKNKMKNVCWQKMCRYHKSVVIYRHYTSYVQQNGHTQTHKRHKFQNRLYYLLFTAPFSLITHNSQLTTHNFNNWKMSPPFIVYGVRESYIIYIDTLYYITWNLNVLSMNDDCEKTNFV